MARPKKYASEAEAKAARAEQQAKFRDKNTLLVSAAKELREVLEESMDATGQSAVLAHLPEEPTELFKELARRFRGKRIVLFRFEKAPKVNDQAGDQAETEAGYFIQG